MSFVKPVIDSIFIDRHPFVSLQGTAAATLPSNPNFDCASLSCEFGDPNTFSLNVTWVDNSGSDVQGYVVGVLIEGDAFDLRDADATGGTQNCQITESPAGTYTLECVNFEFVEGDCDCILDYALVSITDPDGNSLSVTGESCDGVDNPNCQ